MTPVLIPCPPENKDNAGMWVAGIVGLCLVLGLVFWAANQKKSQHRHDKRPSNEHRDRDHHRLRRDNRPGEPERHGRSARRSDLEAARHKSVRCTLIVPWDRQPARECLHPTLQEAPA